MSIFVALPVAGIAALAVAPAIGAGAAASPGIGAEATMGIVAPAATAIHEASDKKTLTKVKAIFIGATIGASIGATAASFCCAPVVPVAASAIGTKISVCAGFGATVSAAIAAIPGLLGFTSGGIASSSIAAWMMSTSAIANGGGVPAGGFVAIMQSIGAVGLGASTVLGIGGIAAVAMGTGLALWAKKSAVVAAATTATSFWTSPVVLIGTGAVAGAIVGYLVCVLVDGEFLYHIFGNEDDARDIFVTEKSANNKMLGF